jgi:aspartate dehydrogenase
VRRRRVLVIGHGAIGRAVLARLPEHAPEALLVGLLVRPARVAETAPVVKDGIAVVGTIADALALRPEIVVECAGHQALRDCGEAVLGAGADLVVASVGALADAALAAALIAAARASGAQLVIPSGAIGGMDALAAARVGGLTRVAYTSRKPPKAWKGTAAEQVADLDAARAAVTLYQGAADAAARTYPQNANVAATIALAGRGMAATEVRLVADPAESGNVHVIEAEGAFGAATITLRGKPMAENPKTSALTAMSLVHAVARRTGALSIG